jgi:DNA invertase Pin-like site-specific DNA recombinase
MSTGVVLYARVSTSNGHQDPEMQLRELRESAASRGWRIGEEYTDLGVSGSKGSRPALNRLMADAGRRKFDVILVWKLTTPSGRLMLQIIGAMAEFERELIRERVKGDFAMPEQRERSSADPARQSMNPRSRLCEIPGLPGAP